MKQSALILLAVWTCLPLCAQQAERPGFLYSIMADMDACYKAQDLDCFCKIMDLEHYSYPGDEQMLKGRNLLWMKKPPGILREKRAFIYVGSGHLCGEYGLLSLLRKEGFFIVPMRYP